METKKYDLIVIGSGPGGHTAALFAAKKDLKTALIEKDMNNLGGTCLNAGCIPFKGFLYHSKFIKNFSIIKEKNLKKVTELRNGLKSKLLNGGIDLINAKAVFKSKDEIVAGEFILNAKNIIIATGSVPKINYDLKNVLTPEKIFELNDIPKKILIIGAGSIGIEYASFFNNLNCDVTVVEILSFVLPWLDDEIRNNFLRELNKKKIKIYTKSKISKINENNEVIIDNEGNEIREKFDIIFEATGRVAFLQDLNLKDTGVLLDENNFIKVDENYKTSVSHIYAIGDCIKTPMLAYTASKEAEIVIEHILTGKTRKIKYDRIPKIVFSCPQAGSVGDIKTDENTKVCKYFFKANGKAYIEEKEAGLIKLFIDKKKNVIKGASLIGEEIVELMNTLSVVIDNGININELRNNLFLHPSYSEIIFEALNYG